MNKSVTKYIFPYSSFHAEHDGHNYFHVKQLLRKLEGLLQPHVSLFIPPPYPVLSQYIPFYEVRRNIKTHRSAFVCWIVKNHLRCKCFYHILRSIMSAFPFINSYNLNYDNFKCLPCSCVLMYSAFENKMNLVFWLYLFI